MPWFASSNIHTPCFHFSLPLLFLVFPPSPHHKLTAPPTPSWKSTLHHSSAHWPETKPFLPRKHPALKHFGSSVFSPGTWRGRGLRWWWCGTWAKWNPCWCIFTACQSEARWCVRGLCYRSREDEGSCGAVAEVVVVGNGVCVYINVCMCMRCVCYMGENHMVSLLSSLTTCRITPINRRVLLWGEHCWL